MKVAPLLSDAARPEAFDRAVATLSAGSKTFRLAARLLPAEALRWGAIVYTFCRYADDAVDEAADPLAAADQVARLRGQLAGSLPASDPMLLFREFCDRSPVFRASAEALLDGVSSDLRPARFEGDEELLRYAYGVAGTVGLLMCGVIGVREARAYPHAIDLGIAMQITNICRDVADDAAMGRRYLPASRLRAAGATVTAEAVLPDEQDAPRVAVVIRDLIELADRYYRSADEGMRFIPLRTRVGMLAAARLYRRIGVKLIRQGANYRAGRTVVGPVEKCWAICTALVALCSLGLEALLPYRGHATGLHQALRGLPGTSAVSGRRDSAADDRTLLGETHRLA